MYGWQKHGKSEKLPGVKGTRGVIYIWLTKAREVRKAPRCQKHQVSNLYMVGTNMGSRKNSLVSKEPGE